MSRSAKTDYACLAMLELARLHGRGVPVRIRQIADRHNIPLPFLVQILQQLKQSGLVASTRGANGGYTLTRQPSDITLADVVAIFEGSAKKLDSRRPSVLAVLLHTCFQEAENAMQQQLESQTLENLVARAGAECETMYYI